MPALLVITWFLAQAPASSPEDFDLPAFPRPAPATPPPPRSKPPQWSALGFELNGLVLANRGLFLGVEATGLVRLGQVRHSFEVPGTLEGWLVELGPQFDWGRASGAACLGTEFCGSRYAGGVSGRVGWARGGLSLATGAARPVLMVYGQLEVLGGAFVIPDAPLSPGLVSGELLVRLGVGGHISFRGTAPKKSDLAFNATLLVELIPVSRATAGVSFGGALGVSL